MTGPFEQIFAEFEKAGAFSRRVQRAITGLDVGQGARLAQSCRRSLDAFRVDDSAHASA
jgi:hypothetical protein